MNKRIACLLAPALCFVSLLHAEDSTVAEGLALSPNNFLAGMTRAVSFEGCRSDPDGEICSVRVKLLEPFAFTSPDSKHPPETFLLLASAEVGERPINPSQCMLFAVPVGKTGAYGATYSVCDPSPAAVARFKDELKKALVDRLFWMPKPAP